MWFLAVAFAHLSEAKSNALAAPLTSMHYESQGDCIDSARQRLTGLSSINIHGKWMCMYHEETDREMRNAPKFGF